MAELPHDSLQGPLAPKFGVNNASRGSIMPGGAPMNSESHDIGGRNYKRVVPIAILGLALLIIPVTMQQLNQNQDIRQRASGPEPTIVLPTSVIRPTEIPTPTEIPDATLSAKPTSPISSPSAKPKKVKPTPIQ